MILILYVNDVNVVFFAVVIWFGRWRQLKTIVIICDTDHWWMSRRLIDGTGRLIKPCHAHVHWRAGRSVTRWPRIVIVMVVVSQHVLHEKKISSDSKQASWSLVLDRLINRICLRCNGGLNSWGRGLSLRQSAASTGSATDSSTVMATIDVTKTATSRNLPGKWTTRLLLTTDRNFSTRGAVARRREDVWGCGSTSFTALMHLVQCFFALQFSGWHN